MINQKKYLKNDNHNNSLENSSVGWNSSVLFYQYLYEVDMDYKEAYYTNNWDMMYKSLKIKYMRVKVFIMPEATDNEKLILTNDTTIKKLLNEMKDGDSDHVSKWNNKIAQDIIEIIEKKMLLIDELMSKAGMNLLLNKLQEDKPAALAMDDF